MDASGAGAESPKPSEMVTEDDLMNMSVKELKNFILAQGGSTQGLLEKSELQAAAKALVPPRTINVHASEYVLPQTPMGLLARELETISPAKIATFLAEKLSELSGGLTVDDLPSVSTTICGKTFQEGDLAYNCRTCQTDGTCVQCHECFNDSNHEGHEVLFHKAGVGGCCDCGDLEAWAVEGCCSQHGPNAQAQADPLESLPAPMLEASQVVFGACVLLLKKIARLDVLSFQQASVTSRVAKGSAQDKEGSYYLLVNNDDVHTFDQVTEALRDSRLNLVTSPRDATTSVDKLGRSAIHRETSLSRIQKVVDSFRRSGLLFNVAPASQLELEKCGVAIVTWLRKICSSSASLIRVLSTELSRDDDTDTRQLAQEWLRATYSWPDAGDEFGTGSVLDTIIRVHALLPKLLVVQLRELFLRMIVDDRFRVSLGFALGRSLPIHARAFAQGLGVQEDTLLHLNVQVFTVKSLAREYQEKFNRSLIMETIEACAEYARACGPSGKIDLRSSGVIHRRYRLFLQCVKYQCNIKVFDSMPTGMIEAAYTKLVQDVLSQFEFLDEHTKRQQLDHVLFEREDWIHAFQVSMDMDDMLTDTAVALSDVNVANRPVILTVLKAALAEVSRNERNFTDLISLGRLPVSFHLPIHRFVAVLCRSLAESSFLGELIAVEEESFLALAVNSPLDLIDHPLRVIVASSQISLGMWRRDGAAVHQEMIFYTTNGRVSLYDLDLCALQMACGSMSARDGREIGAESFFRVILTRYAVFSWLFLGRMSADEAGGLPQSTSSFTGLMEECFRTLILIANSLPRPYEMDEEHYARRAVIHSLAKAPIGGVPFSDVLSDVSGERLLNEDDADRLNGLGPKDILRILATCAKVIQTAEGERRFELEPKLWSTEFDPFYWQLSKAEQEQATEKRERYIASEAPTKPVPFCPEPLPAAKAFVPVVDVFASPFLIQGMIRCILCDAVGANESLRAKGIKVISTIPAIGASENAGLGFSITSASWSTEEQQIRASRSSPGILRAALHLLTMALYEPERIDCESLLQRSTGLPESEGLEFHRFTVLECLAALRTVFNPKEAEGSGLEWILQQIFSNFRDSKGRIEMFWADFRSQQDQSSSAAVSTEKSGKKESRKRKAISAQQAMMERMRNAQQAAVKNFLTVDDVEIDETGVAAGSKPLEEEGKKQLVAEDAEDIDNEDPLTCSLCREAGDLQDLAFFGYSHVSCWERSGGSNPTILSRAGRPPIGWTKPPASTAPTSSPSSAAVGSGPVVAGTGGSGSAAASASNEQSPADGPSPALDWGMTDVQALTSGTSGPYDDEDVDDDDDYDEDDDEMEGGGDLLIGDDGMVEEGDLLMEEGFFAEDTAFEMIEEDDDEAMVNVPLLFTEGSAPSRQSSSADWFSVENPHGKVPPRFHVRCCPHAVHYKCLEEYQKHAHTERTELTKFHEFQCSVCKTVSNTLVFTGGDLAKPLKPISEVREHTSWGDVVNALSGEASAGMIPSTVQDIMSVSADNPNDYYSRTVNKIVGDRAYALGISKPIFALEAVCFSSAVRVDAICHQNEPSTSMQDVLKDSLKSRREMFAIFQTLSRGGLSLLLRDDSDRSSSSRDELPRLFTEFLSTGTTTSLDLMKRLTAEVRQVAVFDCDPKMRISVPMHYTPPTKSSSGLLLDLQEVGVEIKFYPMEKSLVVVSSDDPDQVAVGWRLAQVDEETVEGKMMQDIKLIGKHRYGFVAPSTSRQALLLDVDPLVLFSLLCSLSWKSMTEHRLHLILKLSLAVCMVRSVLATLPLKRSASSSSSSVKSKQEEEYMNVEMAEGFRKVSPGVVAMDQLVRDCLSEHHHTVEEEDAMKTRERLMQDIAAFLVQVSVYFTMFLGKRWADRMMNIDSLLVTDTERLWEAFDLPTPAPFGSTSLRGSDLHRLVSPWIAQLVAVNSPSLKLSSSSSSSQHQSLSSSMLYLPVKPGSITSHFVPLPQKYDELYSRVMNQAVCATRGVSPPKEPALCLLCGDVVCAGAACCKRKDASAPVSILHLTLGEWQGTGLATMHARTCGDGIGAFLFLQRSQVLLVYGGRAIFVPAPYVDAQGEPDPHLRRGRPLTLRMDKYVAIQRMVTEHRLANEVARTRNTAPQILYLDIF